MTVTIIVNVNVSIVFAMQLYYHVINNYISMISSSIVLLHYQQLYYHIINILLYNYAILLYNYAISLDNYAISLYNYAMFLYNYAVIITHNTVLIIVIYHLLAVTRIPLVALLPARSGASDIFKYPLDLCTRR